MPHHTPNQSKVKTCLYLTIPFLLIIFPLLMYSTPDHSIQIFILHSSKRLIQQLKLPQLTMVVALKVIENLYDYRT